MVKTGNAAVEHATLRGEHERLNARLAAPGVRGHLSVADRHGMGLLVHADFDAAEGEYAPSPYLMINLCTAHVGRILRAGDGPRLQGLLRPGTVALALPGTAAAGYWDRTQMLGIAVALDALDAAGAEPPGVDALHAAASQLHHDPLLAAVMTALWRDAETHAASSAFFEQGVQVLLRRLAAVRARPAAAARVRPLAGRRLQQVLDLMESRLEDDVRIPELAQVAGQDVRTFTRAFALATGLAPYAYFTRRRMERARQLLRDPAMAVTAVAMRLGYANPSKFAAAFRRVHGVAPGAWRRLHED
ncbi:MAG TPA: AraC family transcriptional regulator [Pseudoxanthomonas sp.]|nr:AraC family transcriptional regulator [Pseudoxanthomonas sp.]